MKKIIKTIKNYLGEIILVIGVGVLAYNVFNFSYTGGYGGKWEDGIIPLSQLPSMGRYEFKYVAYYYTNQTLSLITIGAMLIVSGLLIIKKKKGVKYGT